MIEPTYKQQLLLECSPNTVVMGGARGGGKSAGLALKMALDVVESYTEKEAKSKKLDLTKFRNTQNDPNYKETIYYKYLIDYSDYEGVIIRRTENALMNQTHKECRKIYPFLGGRWVNKEWVFPSGASITYRPCNKQEHLDWFQGQNKQRVAIEELTQFDQWEVDEIESCCRSANPYIKAMKVYSTNPGKRGHKWVKEKFIDTCKPVKAGEPAYIEKFDITYQPMDPGKPFINKSGETFLFIPSVVFDNPALSENDENYVNNLKSKNEILKRMWLFGDWDVFAGQFFSMWDESKHVISELEFFNAKDSKELIFAKREFDWSDYRLYMSNDYGFAEKSAWACGFYAVDNATDDIVKFAEIVKSGLTIREQARETKQFLRDKYDLTPDDFELVIADPKSYWQRRDKDEGEFFDFASVYSEEGIFLTKGLNAREPGAMAFLEALRIRSDGTPQLLFLDCCVETISSIPNLPSDRRNPNDVDTTVFDHPYDEGRYFLMVIRGEPWVEEKKKKGKLPDWRETAKKAQTGVYEGKPQSWKVA